MSNMCTSFSSRMKQMQVPEFLTRIRGQYEEEDDGLVPYGKRFSTCPDSTKNEDCAVCMGKIRHRPLISKNEADDDLEGQGEVDNEAKEYSSTPCNHVYHGTCLKAWLKNNKQCPTCRA